MTRGTRMAIWLLAGVALVAVFMAYMNPHLAVELANRFWACF